MFLQALGEDDQVLAQVDQQPGEGTLPTSTWLQGETIQDSHRLDMSSTEWVRVIIGLYDPVTGHRLNLGQPSKGQDYFELLVRDQD